MKSDLLKRIPSPRNNSRWTPGEDLLILREDLTLVEMCFMTGRSYSAVSGRRALLRRRDVAGVPQVQLDCANAVLPPVASRREIQELRESGDVSRIVRDFDRGITYRATEVLSVNAMSRSIQIALPYEQTVSNRGQKERFQQGAFARSVKERNHKIQLRSGKTKVTDAVDICEGPGGLHVEFKMNSTDAADEVIFIERTIKAAFRRVRQTYDNDGLVFVECALLHFRVEFAR